VLTSVVGRAPTCFEVFAQLLFTVLGCHFHADCIEPLPLGGQIALELGSVLLQDTVSFRQSRCVDLKDISNMKNNKKKTKA